jgi:hypothetical protein
MTMNVPSDPLAELLGAVRVGQVLAWAMRVAPDGGDPVRAAWAQSRRPGLRRLILRRLRLPADAVPTLAQVLAPRPEVLGRPAVVGSMEDACDLFEGVPHLAEMAPAIAHALSDPNTGVVFEGFGFAP